MKQFYRISNAETEQGLWYDFEGKFTGLIHNKFNFCKNNSLPMDFDPALVGYLSAADTLKKLYEWFPIEDILELQKHGYYLHIYETDNYKFYDKFQHNVIKQSESTLIRKVDLIKKIELI